MIVLNLGIESIREEGGGGEGVGDGYLPLHHHVSLLPLSSVLTFPIFLVRVNGNSVRDLDSGISMHLSHAFNAHS